jgi:hypothetical protein
MADDSGSGPIFDREQIRGVRKDARENPPKANKNIRDAYYRLSRALGELLHGQDGPANATFPTFAAWSAQSLRADVCAGVENRKGARRERLPPTRPARWVYDKAVELTMSDNRAIARNIATGQALIFQEVGPALISLLEVTKDPLDEGNPQWDRVWRDYTVELLRAAHELGSDRASQPDDQKVEPVSAALLQHAVAPYFDVLRYGLREAADEKSRKRRAELILLGNIRLGAYEQKRLQKVLESNLKYLPDALRLRLVTRWGGRETWITRSAVRLHRKSEPIEDLLDQVFQIAATRYVYAMVLGAEVLRFGVDLPLPPPAHRLLRKQQPEDDIDRYAEGNFFPYDLQVIENVELWAEWQQHDRSVGQGARTAVDNWLRLPERLNYIVNLFRSRQQLTALYEPPASIPVPTPPAPPKLGPVHIGLAPVTDDRLEALIDRVGRDGGSLVS